MSGDREVTSDEASPAETSSLETSPVETSRAMRFDSAIRPLLLDGGLATALEDEGYVLDDPLWSAALVSTHPDAIRRVHARYLDAGADVITTATYQATFQGLARAWGQRAALTHAESAQVFRDAVGLADEARREHAARTGRWSYVAASVGSYGAFLADGSEYRGRYGASRETLLDVHAPRLDLLGRDPRVDVLACETVPSGEEAVLLAELLVARDLRGWVSVVVQDLEHEASGCLPEDEVPASVRLENLRLESVRLKSVRLVDGTPLRDVAEAIASVGAASHGGVASVAIAGGIEPQRAGARWSGVPRVGMGINCVRPSRVTAALPVLRTAGIAEIAAYANAGEGFGPSGWCGRRADPVDYAEHARAWIAAGATLVGGCCRTTPAHIAALRHLLVREP